MSQPPLTRYSLLQDAVFILLFSIPGLTWLSSTDNLASYFLYQNLDGQFLYVISKLIGLYAMMLIWFQVVLGLFRSYLPAQVRQELPAFHRRFGLAALIMIVLHILLFVTAVSLRNDHIAWALFMPKFSQGYYAMMLTMGLLAIVFILAAVLLRGPLNKIQNKYGQWLHRLNLVAFYLILLHSYTIGSESRAGLMPVVYLILIGSVTAVLGYRALSWARYKLTYTTTS